MSCVMIIKIDHMIIDIRTSIVFNFVISIDTFTKIYLIYLFYTGFDSSYKCICVSSMRNLSIYIIKDMSCFT